MTNPTFDPVKHEYSDANGRLLTPVTHLMKVMGLINGFSIKEDPSYRYRGQAVHEACRAIDEKTYDEDGTHELIRPYARQYQRFLDDVGYSARGWEISMAHLVRGFGGTIDTFGLDGDGEPTIVDIKTGTSMPTGVGIQLAAYEDLIREGVWIRPPESDASDVNWAAQLMRTKPKTIWRRLCLQLPGGDATRGVLREFSEQKHIARWRAALTLYDARKEFGLL